MGLVYMERHDKLPKWAQRDILDMMDSVQTEFDRCNKCKRIHDLGLRCPHCGHDNSEDKRGI
jgi:hypothetical protein